MDLGEVIGQFLQGLVAPRYRTDFLYPVALSVVPKVFAILLCGHLHTLVTFFQAKYALASPCCPHMRPHPHPRSLHPPHSPHHPLGFHAP